MRSDHGLALQATLEVEPVDKRHPLVLRSGLVIGPLLIERFDSEKDSNLLARKTYVLELPNLRRGWELLLYFHSCPPVSLWLLEPSGAGCTTCNAVVVSHHVVMLHLQRPLLRNTPICLDKRAEARDRPAHNERVHFAGAFVGVNSLGIGHLAPHLVVEQDAVTSQ